MLEGGEVSDERDMLEVICPPLDSIFSLISIQQGCEATPTNHTYFGCGFCWCMVFQQVSEMLQVWAYLLNLAVCFLDWTS